jgi:hypothetical protein
MSPTFESTQGRRARFADFLGRPTVVFYEGKGREKDNDVIKSWCARLLEQRVADFEVLGIANLNGLGFVRGVVVPVVRAVAASYGVELWMDFKGQLLKAPYHLDGDVSNVMILDAQGETRFVHRGALGQAEIERFVEVFRSCLREEGALDHVALPV